MDIVTKLAYVASAIMFILGLKLIAHPRTAVKGNWLSAAAMFFAIVITLFSIYNEPGTRIGYYIIAGLVVGSVVGGVFALKVEMTSMPQLVALFNGFGGAASVFVAAAELLKVKEAGTLLPSDVLVAAALSGLIGTITFWGSLVAFGKLQELKQFKKPFALPMQQLINGIMALALLGLIISMAATEMSLPIIPFILIIIIASVLGVFVVSPIGGADMPVVIALLNSYSGLAAAATGFVINNNVLIISGSLVGASGIILSQIMCKAMNRSLVNVLFGSMQASAEGPDADEVYQNVRSTSADDVAMILETAQRVVVVPGYGLAVAQAQHAVRDMADLLEENGTTVEYAIHPVAGRMPGHMNVLLAEADVPYDKLKEMDEINPTMGQVDVAIVIGANDVVNPVAKTDPTSPIAGMPIIDVDQARTVIVIKRSLSPGFAGIPNPLFSADNTLMLFGDGKKAVLDIVAAIKENS